MAEAAGDQFDGSAEGVRLVEREPSILIARIGASGLEAAEVIFQLAPDGSIGLSAEILSTMAGDLKDGDIVWFRPGLPYQLSNPGTGEVSNTRKFIEIEDIFIDLTSKIIRVGDEQEQVLRNREARVLELLVENANRVTSRGMILNHVWGTPDKGDLLSVIIHRLRNKMQDYEGEILQTRRKEGYLLRVPSLDGSELQLVSASIDELEEPESLRLEVTKGLIIDYDMRTIEVSGNTFTLTFKEFELLTFLISNRGKVVSREQIVSNVWGEEYIYSGGDYKTVDVHIRRLRKHLTEDFSWIIRTSRGVGYVLVSQE